MVRLKVHHSDDKPKHPNFGGGSAAILCRISTKRRQRTAALPDLKLEGRLFGAVNGRSVAQRSVH
jgi:hypothetical protein